MRRVQIIGALCLAVVACLVSAVSASAAPGEPFQYQYSLDSAAVGGMENVVDVDVNTATGNVLVLENGRIDQFDASGEPVNFTATGSPSLQGVGGSEYMFVDNSGGATQGNIYAAAIGFANPGDGFFWAFTPSGEPLASAPINVETPAWGGTVGPDGKLWFLHHKFGGNDEQDKLLGELTPTDVATGVNFPVFGISSYVSGVDGGYLPIAADALGNFYMPGPQSYLKYDSKNGFALLGDTGLPRDKSERYPLAIDPTTNALYERHQSKVVGVPYSEPLVKSEPSVALEGVVKTDTGIAFDSTGDLYVAERNTVNRYHREPNKAPFGLPKLKVDGIRSSRAVLYGGLAAGGAPTSYRFEYGTDLNYGEATAMVQAPFSLFPINLSMALEGLQPNTTYHVRLAATNSVGTTYSPDRVIKTYGISNGGAGDTCPNALARKQTIAQRLPDCRAYELASAADTGGYDVESYLAPGQNPFPGFPMAIDKLLYSTHSGAVPGPWNATNKGPDPYVATRTANGWVTQYEGLPSNLNPAAGSFSSVLGEADQSLSTLAFAGPKLCSPCFTSGSPQTGIPVRLPSGQLVQGMSGSLAGSVPAAARPEGKVAKYFSGDGKKLLFASKYAFEPGANENGSDLTVYERNLAAGTTEIVSTDPSGNALSGEGISELDVSSNGSRVVIGKKLGTDPLGNELVHPYLHISGRPASIDLAPLASTGVLYAGMTADGSKVFFTSADKLDGSDTDSSGDLYEADVDGSGNLSLKAITAANDSDACAPIDCSAAPIAGGGGVASSTGAIYFLSPEQFGGQGTLNQANLYLAEPSGSISLIATLEPSNPLLLDSLFANGTRKTGDFQTTPSGNYAAFTSELPLTGVSTHGFRSVYRYAAGSGHLDCASCDMTGTDEASIFAAGELASNGLSLLEDGRLFFTTAAQLLLNDTNARKDVYEWTNGEAQLVSAGAGPFDSALLSASADGTDVFFFTHDSLASEEDHNGNLMKIYDAREGGGFFKLPASVPCQAADECHGPGTPTPGPADIKSSGKTTQGNVIVCAKNRVKKRGQCVKKKQAHAKKKHHKKKRKGAKKRAAGTNGKRGGRNA
jgi:hypothetical protein